MAVYVDAKDCVVRDGVRAWPFDIDCHDGAAHVTLNKRRYTLYPLGWREKCSLARFTHLGESFLQNQFLRAALKEGDAELPVAEEARAVLSALARWINAPDGNFGLPLDRQLLASVTLDICRSMHLAPTAFDALNASDVEMLWQAARSAHATPDEASTASASGMTRIVVLPEGGDSALSATPAVNLGGAPSLARGGAQAHQPSSAEGAVAVATQRPDAVQKSTAEKAVTANAPIAKCGSAADISSVRTSPPTEAKNSKDTTRAETLQNRFRIAFLAPGQIAEIGRGEAHYPIQDSLRKAASARLDCSEIRLDANAQTFATPLQDMPLHSIQGRGEAGSAQASVPIIPAALRNDYPRTAAVRRGATPSAVVQLKVVEPEPLDVGAPVEQPALQATTRAFPQQIQQAQLADQIIATFAERLNEAAHVAGIDVDY